MSGTLSYDNKSVRWFVMRAYKAEKLAEEKLAGQEAMQFFIPKQYAVRSYHGVKTRRLVPVIPSLVFVNASQERLIEFKKTYNFLQFAMHETGDGLEYMSVPDDQMENFMKVSMRQEASLTYYKPDEIDFRKGTRVRIHGGMLDGVEGVFMRLAGKRNRRIVVVLDGILAVSAEVSPDLVEVVK